MRIAPILLAPLFFLWSYILLASYAGGDQVFYTKLYSSLHGASISESLVLAYDTVGSVEPISIFFLWLGSNLGIDKLIYISFCNIVLYMALYYLILKYKANFFIFLILINNFYFLVLMTGAERLKFGYIFLLFAMVFASRFRITFLIISSLAHFQILLLIPSLFLAKYYKDVIGIFVNFKVKKDLLIYLVSILGFFAFFIYVFNDVLMGKISAYLSFNRGVSEFFNVALLAVVALLATSNRSRMIISLLPIIVFILLLGGERVNMIAVTLVLGLLILEGRLNSVFLFPVLFYFFVKSIIFIFKVFNYGDGFAKLNVM